MENLVTLKEGTAWADNQSTLDKIGEKDGELTFDGKEIGGAAERPTAEYTYDFSSGDMFTTATANEVTFYIPRETLTEDAEELTLIGKEIENVEFERSSGEWVSLKDMAEVDLLPWISMTNHIIEKTIEDIDSIVFTSVYFPSTPGWLWDEAQTFSLMKIKVTYYTD